MKRQPLGLGSCLVLLFASAPVVYADPLLDAYSERIQAVSHVVFDDIRPALDEDAREVIDRISVESPNSWITNAAAWRGTHRRRVVEFNAGLLAITDWLALSMIAEHEGHSGCLREYSTYLVRNSRKNSKRILRGHVHSPMLDFEAYARATKGACEQAHVDVGGEENIEFRERILNGVIATVLLHEAAHHVLGHVDSDKRGSILVHMREAAADQWAIRIASKADYDLRAAVPLFLFLAASGGGSLEDDIRSTHPSGLRRVRDLLTMTREYMSAKDPVSARLMDVSIDELNRTFLQ